jgi:hypothetical protein
MQISKEFLFDFAFMNPNTMKLMNINIGDSVCLSTNVCHTNTSTTTITNSSLIIITCWPCAQINPSQISLSKHYLLINDIHLESHLFLTENITKSNSRHLLQVAKRVNIEFIRAQSTCDPFCRKKSIDRDEEEEEEGDSGDLKLILGFLKEIHTNKILVESDKTPQSLFLIYMGQLLVFKIESMEGGGGGGEKLSNVKKTVNLNALTNELCNFSIDKKQHQQFAEVNLKPIEILDFFRVDENLKYFKIVNGTQFNLINTSESLPQEKLTLSKLITLNDIGGLEKEIDLLREFFINPFKFAKLYEKIGKLDRNGNINIFSFYKTFVYFFLRR